MHNNKIAQLLTCFTLSLSAMTACAAVSAVDAQALKSTLTPMGA